MIRFAKFFSAYCAEKKLVCDTIPVDAEEDFSIVLLDEFEIMGIEVISTASSQKES